MAASGTIKIVSECFIHPPNNVDHPDCFHLSPWDLMQSDSQHYVQYGLLFPKKHREDENGFMEKMLQRLKHSLSLALAHFYPFAGRVIKTVDAETNSYSLHVDCSPNGGARFVYAVSDSVASSDLAARGADVPESVVHSLFRDDRAPEYGDPEKSLLTMTVTKLADGGVFVGICCHHGLADGTSIWHFVNTWSEIFQNLPETETVETGASTGFNISRPPMMDRWFPEGHCPPLIIPLRSDNQANNNHNPVENGQPSLRARMFRISSQKVSDLKARAIAECRNNDGIVDNASAAINVDRISTFQSVAAFMWKSITRARGLPDDQMSIFVLPINCRSKLDLSPNYFGNVVIAVTGVSKAGEVAEKGVGWAAWQMKKAVANYSDREAHDSVDDWLRSRWVVSDTNRAAHPGMVVINDYTKFDIFGNEFGALGKPQGFFLGNRMHKWDGVVCCYSLGGGKDGGFGLEVWLQSQAMSNLLSDQQFMEMVS